MPAQHSILFPIWEEGILPHAGNFGEDAEVVLVRTPGCSGALRAWYTEAKRASWKSPRDVKAAYRPASILRNNRVVFNIKGNSYGLIVAIKYEFQIVYIRFIGTHIAYDRINAEEV